MAKYAFKPWGILPRFICAIFCLLLLSTTASGQRSGGATRLVPNIVTVTETRGVGLTNYPLQIGRPFMPGEIPDFPQAAVDQTPVLTQADVKQRYPDGSVKFAILSFIIPSVPPKHSVHIAFQDQTSGNNTPLSVSDMSAPAYDFDATMLLAGAGGTKSVSAAAMLAAGDFTYWTQGPVATTIILADHLNRKYDLGFDQYRPFRPIFHATFWPALGKVRVRFIGEVSNTEELEDVPVTDLQLSIGHAAPALVYEMKSPLTMIAASRWTKEFWIGGAPESQVNIDYNLAYLAQTRFVPNLDPSIVVPESALSTQYAAWQKAKRDLYDNGLWQKLMPNVGGRPDLGPLTLWVTHWLYTGDWRAAEIAQGMADLAGAWPLHLREGNPAKYFDRAGKVPGAGKVMSISNRPTIALYTSAMFTYSYTKTSDKIKLVGPMTSGGWLADGAHQPNPYSVPYIFTGDYWYLEQMQLWAAFSAARYNGAATTLDYGRGPTGSEGGIHDEVRGDGWVLRSRAEAAFLSPDGSPEKDYFTTLVNDALAIWEGERRIHGTGFENTPNWTWGYKMSQQDVSGKWTVIINHASKSLGPPPLQFWENNTANGYIQDLNDGTNTIQVGGATAVWMQGYLIYGLGRAGELGFASGPLLAWAGTNLISQAIDPVYNGYLTGAYHTPVMKADNTYFQSWADVREGFPAIMQNTSSFPGSAAQIAEGYAFSALAATAMLSQFPGGPQAWTAIHKLLTPELSLFKADPRYAILPRNGSTASGRTPGAIGQ